MEIKGITKEETAYDKYVQFIYEGENYSVLLHWDKWDGFDITFTDLEKTRHWIDAPDWAITWDENNEESLAYVLDYLTDETLEASYL